MSDRLISVQEPYIAHLLYIAQELKIKKSSAIKRKYLHYKGRQSVKNELRNVFTRRRKDFDRALRRSEREYRAKQRDELCSLRNQDPRQFWERVKQMAPGGKKEKVDSVRKNDGTLSSDTGDIGEAFKHTFSDIYRATDHDRESITGYKNLINQMENDTHTNNDRALNEPIRMEELQKAIKVIQKGKAVGVDNIPNEIIKMPSLQPILHKLFETCFNSSISPEMWHKNIIHPILKPGKDSKCAGSYRGISLMSTVAKVYNSILN